MFVVDCIYFCVLNITALQERIKHSTDIALIDKMNAKISELENEILDLNVEFFMEAKSYFSDFPEVMPMKDVEICKTAAIACLDSLISKKESRGR